MTTALIAVVFVEATAVASHTIVDCPVGGGVDPPKLQTDYAVALVRDSRLRELKINNR
ncbi:MAG: hypothetical protein U0992_13040 [Planctomycetaceae bacterium]